MADYSMVRKLTTIVAIDAVGFSTMAAANEDQALRLLRQRLVTVESFVKQHEGRVFKMTGDGLLAEFASPVEAVRAAVEIQEAMRTANSLSDDAERLQLRIGVNLGDIVESGPDLLGDGVNVAVRLESLAPSGGICVSSSIYDQIVGKLTLGAEDLGEQHVKNIPRPIRAYRLKPSGWSIPASSEAKRRPRVLSPWILTTAAVLLMAVGALGTVMITRLADKDPKPAAASNASPSASPQAAVPAPVPPSPERAAAANVRLVPENVPFVSDQKHRDIANYLSAEGPKALAINVRGYSGYATRRTDEATARQIALDACNSEVKRFAPTAVQPYDACEIYAVGDRVVWTYKAPPLPPPPYYSDTPPRPTRMLDAAAVPLVADVSRKVIGGLYATGTGEKAIALGRRKMEWSVWGTPTRRETVRRALQSCGHLSGHTCFIYAIGDEVIVRVPDEYRAIEVLVPADFEPGDRDTLSSYLIAGDWRAIAAGTNGRLGIATREASERDATAAALRACIRANGTDCAIRAVGPYLVARQ